MEATRASLIAHLGGTPSAVEQALIDRIAILTVHVSLFDKRAFAAGALSERDSRAYLAYSNSLSRALAKLGVRGSAAKTVNPLADHLARNYAARSGAAR